jgi:hypothetical protein
MMRLRSLTQRSSVWQQQQFAPHAIDVEHADLLVGRINGARYLRASVAAGQQ